MRLAAGTATVERIDALDAPVVVRLRRPDGRWLDVRRSGRTWFRPVLSPGTWDGLSLDAYARHVVDAPAWADNPFVPWPVGRMVPLSLDDFVPERAPDDVAHAQDMARDGAKAIERARRVALIDGVVHRETDEPALTVVMTMDGASCPGWRTGTDLMHHDDQSTLMGEADEAISPPSYRRSRSAVVALPPTCGEWMAELVGLASRHGRDRALGHDGGPAPFAATRNDAVRAALHGRGWDRTARVLASVDGWDAEGVMRSLSRQAWSMHDGEVSDRLRRVRHGGRGPDAPEATELRSGDLARLTLSAADAMAADPPDVHALDGCSQRLSAWLDGHDRRSMPLKEALITAAGRLCIDRFHLMMAAAPREDPEEVVRFAP